MSITIEDVCDFIWTAHNNHLNRIADELKREGERIGTYLKAGV